MNTLREAAKQALDALNGVLDTYGEPLDLLSISGGTYEALQCRDAITHLRAALEEPVLNPAPGYCKHCKQYTIEESLPAEPVQEPVWVCPDSPEHRYDKPGHCEDCGKTLVQIK